MLFLIVQVNIFLGDLTNVSANFGLESFTGHMSVTMKAFRDDLTDAIVRQPQTLLYFPSDT